MVATATPQARQPSPAATAPHHDPDITLAFLSLLMPPAGATCLEMRVLGADFGRGGYIQAGERYSKSIAGWYNDARSLAVDAGRLRGVSGYVIPNPTITDMLACSANALKVAKQTTQDKHIAYLRWLFLDFDADKPASDMSATDAERAAALAKRDAVLAGYPAMAGSAVWGSSGNGGWLLVRLPDYPNDEAHRKVIARAVDFFAANHGADDKTKNPARLMPLAGTVKCKGSHVPERPWRVVTLDSSHDRQPEPFDLAGWVAELEGAGLLPSEAASTTRHATPTTRTTPRSSKSSGSSVAILDAPAGDRIRRAALYLDRIAPAISGEGGCHNQTFDAACALIKGFDLAPYEAAPILAVWNQRCQPPWTAAELDHKLADADERPDDKPRGYLFDATRTGGTQAAQRAAAVGDELAAEDIIALVSRMEEKVAQLIARGDPAAALHRDVVADFAVLAQADKRDGDTRHAVLMAKLFGDVKGIKTEFKAELKAAEKRIAAQRDGEAREAAYQDMVDDMAAERESKPQAFIEGKDGLLACAHNTKIWMTMAGQKWSFDSFNNVVLLGDEAMTDRMVGDLLLSIEGSFGVPWKEQCIRVAAVSLAHRYSFSPLTRYLDGLAWDGVLRVDRFLSDHFGIDQTSYHGEVSRLIFLPAVARAYRPGCKVDTVPILSGKQGAFKSTTIASLCPDPKWFADEIGNELGAPKAGEGLSGKWLIELPELARIKRSAAEAVKSFISRPIDNYRPAYGRIRQDFPRTCVFFGTTNSECPLEDDENRRFLVVRVKEGDPTAVAAGRDQFWAEAVHRFKAGEKWWTTDDAIQAEVQRHAESAREADAWEDILRRELYGRERTTMAEAGSALGVHPDKLDRSVQTRIGKALKALGFKNGRETSGLRERFYEREPSNLVQP